jgi:UDP-glucuronate 4-epimerase
MKVILVTGAAGFIGYHLCKKLISENYRVVGLDNINSYYDIRIKYDRLEELGIDKIFAEKQNKLIESKSHGTKLAFIRLDLENTKGVAKLFQSYKFDAVCNLAAQAGVRYSITNPQTYIGSNIHGFLNILECCRNYNVKKLIYASSSSVYGVNNTIPFREDQNVDKPISLYAATKKSNELMAHCYSHLYNIQTIGLRFFTVYGPHGRPDMAPILFAKAIKNNSAIKVFNNGEMSRDFTFIDDIILGLFKSLSEKIDGKYRIFNLGHGGPVKLMAFIEAIERSLEKRAIKTFEDMQDGDVYYTWADITSIEKELNYVSNTDLNKGIKIFIDWFKDYKYL